MDFHFLVPKRLHTKFGKKRPSSFLEKQVLIFICKCPGVKVKKCPWPRAFISDGLDFISILKSTLASEKWKNSDFPNQLPMEPKLTLPQNRSRSTKGHDLYKLCSTTDPNATCQVSRQLAQWFWRRRFYKILSIFEQWRPSWSCDLDNLFKLSFPLPKEAPHKIWLWSAKRFQRRRCLKSVNGRRTTTTDNDGPRTMGIL